MAKRNPKIKLKVDDRVRFIPSGSDTDLGTVVEIDWNAVKVRWDAGVVSIIYVSDIPSALALSSPEAKAGE